MRRPVWTAFLILFGFALVRCTTGFPQDLDGAFAASKNFPRMAAGDFRPVNVERLPETASTNLHAQLNRPPPGLDASIGVLTDERNRSSAILGSMIEGVAVISEDERIVFSNRRVFPNSRIGGRRRD